MPTQYSQRSYNFQPFGSQSDLRKTNQNATGDHQLISSLPECFNGAAEQKRYQAHLSTRALFWKTAAGPQRQSPSWESRQSEAAFRLWKGSLNCSKPWLLLWAVRRPRPTTLGMGRGRATKNPRVLITPTPPYVKTHEHFSLRPLLSLSPSPFLLPRRQHRSIATFPSLPLPPLPPIPRRSGPADSFQSAGSGLSPAPLLPPDLQV